MGPKTDLHVKLVGEDGNIFNLAGIVKRELEVNGYRDLASEMVERIPQCSSYSEALGVLYDYVHVE